VVTVKAGSGLHRIDKDRYAVRPGRRQDYDDLVALLKRDGFIPDKIVHLWNATSPARFTSPSEELDLDRGFYSLMSLAQALGEADILAYQLSVVASEAHIVTGSEKVCPEHAALVGPCNVIPQEYPRVSARLIDVYLPVENTWRSRALLSNLYCEICSDDFADRVVALRGHQRWTRSFEQQLFPPASGPAPALLRPNGVYMITGGLGGIGLAVAEGLASAVGAKLVLVGRTPLAAHAGPSGDQAIEYKLGRLQRLKELGAEVLVVSADISDAAQSVAAVQEAIRHFGDLHGVFHVAGVPGEGLIQLKTAEKAAQVLAPKIQGTLALERALQDRRPDFLVLFSSVNAVTGGGPGQIDYSAANAFLDAHAASLIGEERATISIGWNEWQWNAWEAGLDGFSPQLRDRFRANRKKYGITFAEGIQALYQIMDSRLPHVVVSPIEFNGVIASSRAFTTEALSRMGLVQEATRPRYPRPSISSSYLAPRNAMEEKIAVLWGEALGIAEVGVLDNFFDLGGNSLVGLEMVAQLKKRLGVAKIPAHVIYEAPSVSELAKFLSQDWDEHNIALEKRQSRGARRREAVAERERARDRDWAAN
jgi:NAD(P)-dependent dehydrogenase (short-subunit alcohol dehydrogenase family)